MGLEVEGQLRIAGDGFEWSEFYLDDNLLEPLLNDAIPPTVHKQHHWVVDPDQCEAPADCPPAWTPFDPDPQEAAYWKARIARQTPAPQVRCLHLYADYGRVRITVERIADE